MDKAWGLFPHLSGWDLRLINVKYKYKNIKSCNWNQEVRNLDLIYSLTGVSSCVPFANGLERPPHPECYQRILDETFRTILQLIWLMFLHAMLCVVGLDFCSVLFELSGWEVSAFVSDRLRTTIGAKPSRFWSGLPACLWAPAMVLCRITSVR